MDEAARRSQTAKGGPRVWTIVPTMSILVSGVPSQIINNCPKCPGGIPTGAVVWNEDSVEGAVDLFVHGWYSLETDLTIFWQQVNPSKACETNPFVTGRKLSGGACIPFFVDEATRDGVLVIGVCAITDVTSIPIPCGDAFPFPFSLDLLTTGFIRVNRVDTVLKMSETGDNASNMTASISAACGPALPPVQGT